MVVGVLNGVNLNLLDRRDPAVYGGLSLPRLEEQIRGWGQELGCDVDCRQTNSEGEYVDWCQELGESADGLIVNPGACRTTATRSTMRWSRRAARSSRCICPTSRTARIGVGTRC